MNPSLRQGPDTDQFHSDGVSKRVSPRESGDDQDSRRNFCFVDFATREQAQAAKDAVHGSSYRDGQLKVSEAVPKTERQGNDRYVRRSERSDNRDVRNELA